MPAAPETPDRAAWLARIQADVPLAPYGVAWRGTCPWCAADTLPSFYAFPTTGRWVCFACGRRGRAWEGIQRHA